MSEIFVTVCFPFAHGQINVMMCVFEGCIVGNWWVLWVVPFLRTRVAPSEMACF